MITSKHNGEKITGKVLSPAIAVLCYSWDRESLQRGSGKSSLVWITAKQAAISGAPRNSQEHKLSRPSFRVWGGFFCVWSLYLLTQSKCQKLLLWGRLNTPRADLNFLSHIKFCVERLTGRASALLYFLSAHRSSFFSGIPFCHWTYPL